MLTPNIKNTVFKVFLNIMVMIPLFPRKMSSRVDYSWGFKCVVTKYESLLYNFKLYLIFAGQTMKPGLAYKAATALFPPY
jgi:hypothetical protein